MSRYLLGIDLGTSATKAALFDVRGKMLGVHSVTYQVQHPKPAWAELSPCVLWSAVRRALKQITKSGQVDPKEIAGIGISSMANTPVLLDTKGRELCPAILWIDKRSLPQCDQLERTFGRPYIHRITGLELDPSYFITKVLWIKQNKPNTFRKTRKILFPGSYVAFKLTGDARAVVDYSLSSFGMLLNVHRLEWWREILSIANLSEDQLPELASSTEIVGEISGNVALRTGLKKGTPVVIGGMDQSCSALGMGTTEPGSASVNAGTSTTIICVLSKPTLDPERRLICSCHVVDKRWMLMGVVSTTGALIDWLIKKVLSGKFSMHAGDHFQTLTRLAEAVDPGSDGLVILPHFMGAFTPRKNPRARGAFLGLTLKHGLGHIARAIMESTAFELLANIRVLESLGIRVGELKLAGGAARSHLWNQIRADVTGVRVVLLRTLEASALGAALLAGIGTKVYKSPGQATRMAVSPAHIFAPRMEVRERYEEISALYEELYKKLY